MPIRTVRNSKTDSERKREERRYCVLIEKIMNSIIGILKGRNIEGYLFQQNPPLYCGVRLPLDHTRRPSYSLDLPARARARARAAGAGAAAGATVAIGEHYWCRQQWVRPGSPRLQSWLLHLRLALRAWESEPEVRRNLTRASAMASASAGAAGVRIDQDLLTRPEW
eukprot:g56760.t1